MGVSEYNVLRVKRVSPLGSVFLLEVHRDWFNLKSAGCAKIGKETTIHTALANPNFRNFCFVL